MIQLLAPLLGGLGGLLFPAAGAAAAGGAAATGIGALLAKGALPALGAGLGTLVAGGGGKDAIRNALLMGVGVNAFPGLAGKIQGSGFGQSVTEGLAGIFGGGQEQAPMTSPRPMARPQGGSESGLATMSTAGAAPERTGIATPGDRQSPMSTIPTISDINMVRPEGLQVLPQVNMVRPEGIEVPFNMIRPEGMETPSNMVRRDYGTGIPATLPPVIMPGSGINREEQLSDMQRALDMTREPMSLLSAISPATHRQAFAQRRGRDNALLDIYNRRARPGLRGFAMGGEIEGPGTGTSDSIPAEIYQDGKPVQKAALSDGEFVMTADAVKGAGKGSRERGVSRMYELMRRFESGEMA
jgi:hypothetical protein